MLETSFSFGAPFTMIAEMIRQLAARLMKHPAAPYHEHEVRSEVERICEEHQLPFERDQFGNVLVRWRTDARQRPIVLAAHLDHPGFELMYGRPANARLARFRGGVPDGYFRRGIPLRLMPGKIPARLGRRKDKPGLFELETNSNDGRGPGFLPRFAVWELEDFAVRRGQIHGRSCDDLIGVAAILAALIDLKRRRARVDVFGLISRAEEVGFHGALACSASGLLPAKSLVISLETSRELPGVKMGKGVILRVGDRTSIFDPEATRFLAAIASDLAASKKGFQFQRGLMSGGTCEATAFQEFGFQTTAVCIALGNYHNCAPGMRIAAEYVNIADARGMVDLLVHAAEQMRHYEDLIGKLPRRLKEMLRDARKDLRATAEA
jgi:endoglucanase